MILGCDIGTGYTKAVLLEGGSIRYYVIRSTEANPDKVLEKVFSDVEMNQKIRRTDIDEVVLTGWGEKKVSMEHKSAPLFNCLGKAAVWDVPTCRSVICMGSQQVLSLAVSEEGRVIEYRVNEKCASGSGRFLELASTALEVDRQELSATVEAAKKDLRITSQCAVFAESEVITLVNDGECVADILAAVVRSLAETIASIAGLIRLKKDCVLCGGLAHCGPLVNRLGRMLELEPRVFRPVPDIAGALGAALHGG